MNIKQKISMLMIAVVAVFAVSMAPTAVFADDCKDTDTTNCCGNTQTSIIACNEKNDGEEIENNAIWALLMMVINIMTAGIGILAVAGIVYGAVLYTTAEDKADQVKKATNIITNVVIGLVMYALMWVGLNFLIPGGVFA